MIAIQWSRVFLRGAVSQRFPKGKVYLQFAILALEPIEDEIRKTMMCLVLILCVHWLEQVGTVDAVSA